MNISVIGIDIAKHIFHLIGLDTNGKQVLKKSCVARRYSITLETRKV